MDGNASKVRMGTKRQAMGKSALIVVALSTLAACSVAQGFTFNETTTKNDPKKVVAGTPTIDVVRLNQGSPTVPLRHGYVLADSEILYAGGKKLAKGTDYQIDYTSGVIYLMRLVKVGDTMTVSYRYDPNQTNPTGSSTSLTSMKLDMIPSALKFTFGYGMTERQSDGNVITTNIYGWNNAFGFGQSKISGLFYVGQRNKVETADGYSAQAVSGATDVGTSQFILQKLATTMSGGTIEASYQDISKNFSNFQSVRESGYEVGYIDQITKEKGLTRMGLAMKDVKVGDAKVSQSYKEVNDGTGTISWQQYALAQGGFSMSWNQQKVGKQFSRFSDIYETDRAQLQKEAGVNRDTFGAAFNQKSFLLSYNQSTIGDSAGIGVFQENIKLESGRLKFASAEQRIGESFTKFANLSEADRTQWARETGLSRKSISIDYGMNGAKGAAWTYAQNEINSENGSFRTSDLSANGNGWTFIQKTIGTDSGFGKLSALSVAEQDAYIKSIASMYAMTSVAIAGNDKTFLIQESGLKRTFDQFKWAPTKGLNIEANRIGLEGVKDSANIDSLKVAGKNFDGLFTRRSVGSSFNELSTALTFERGYLGTMLDLDREDLALNFQLGGKRTLSVANTTASLAGSELDRTTVKYSGKDLEINAGQRNLDSGFATTGLVDSEKDALAALVGYKETDFSMRWQALKGLSFNSYIFDANNDSSDITKAIRNLAMNWTVDKNTNISVVSQHQSSTNPSDILYVNELDQFALTRNLGKYGTFKYQKDVIDYNGTQTTLPSLEREYASYEAKINDKTTFKTEQTYTDYSNGTQDKLSANTISTELTKKVGVSLTDTISDKEGTDNDTRKQNMGFWWDVVSGVRFSYGYVGNDAGASSVTQELFGLTNAAGSNKLSEAGFTAATYNVTNANGIKAQSASNVQFAMTKPIRLGFLTNVKLGFGYDAAENATNFTKDNRQFSFSGKLGPNTIGFEYKGQLNGSGLTAADRVFAFATDQNDKLPVKASLYYKERTTPGADEVAIRNISVSAKPVKGVEVTHSNITNPETVNSNALLGSVIAASRAEKWKLDWKQNASITFGGSFEELFNDQAKTSSRTAGVNMVLFAKTASPITLFYGLEEAEQNGAYKSNQRYNVKFDQKAGPNQIFSMFIGNVSYQGSLAGGTGTDNWTVRLDYQLRF